jgi:hypothetical protein
MPVEMNFPSSSKTRLNRPTRNQILHLLCRKPRKPHGRKRVLKCLVQQCAPHAII